MKSRFRKGTFFFLKHRVAGSGDPEAAVRATFQDFLFFDFYAADLGLSPRMIPAVHCFESVLGDMGIDLGGPDVHMAQHDLY